MRTITKTQVETVINLLHANCMKADGDKQTLREMAVSANISYNKLRKVREILIVMHLLCTNGNRRGQTSFWNPNKSAPTSAMALEVYYIYTNDSRSKVKVVFKKEKRLPSIQLAFLAFKNAGWDELTLKKTDGYKTVVEMINLSKIEE